MTIRNLHYFFSPKSVAVIGATDRAASVGATVMRNVLQGGYEGELYPVNPHHDEVAGVPCYRNLDRLPQAPELAVICTPPATVPALVAQLGALGTRAVIVMTAGLDAPAKQGGTTLRQAMLDAAKPHVLRILGPNCVGLLSPRARLNASFAPAQALPGRIAFVSQSGAMVTAMLDWAGARGIGFSSFVSLGDCTDVDVGDMLDYLAGDPETQAVMLYLEGVGDAAKFMTAARAAARCKPVVVLKAGSAPEGARAAATHTGALAGADLVCDAAIRRAGMLRVHTAEALFEAAETLARTRPLRGERLGIITNGGGLGVLAADALAAGGGKLAVPGPDLLARLSAGLPATWSHANPVDIIGDAPAERYAHALQAMLDSDDTDAVLMLHAPTAIVPSVEIARLVAPMARSAGKPVLFCWMGGVSVAAARGVCGGAGLPVFDTPETAVDAFLQQVGYARNQRLLMEAPPAMHGSEVDAATARALVRRLLAEGTEVVPEAEAKAILAAYGIPAVETRIAHNVDEALAAAQAIGYPVAVKLRSPDVTHKSDVGGVVLDVAGPQALRVALDAIASRLARQLPHARLDGYTVQAMVQRPAARELFAGIATDPVFGPVVLFGHGGIAVEAIGDRAVALPPLNRVLAGDLVSRTQVAKLLGQVRQWPPADLDALCDALVRVGQLAADIPEIAEMDINPLLADADGVLALDARIRLDAARGGKLAITPYPRYLARRHQWQGETIEIRPIRPEDGAAHLAFFRALTAEDVHYRMFTSVASLSPSQLARFTQIDYAREMALVAVAERGGVAQTLGVARVVADPDHMEGEFAVIVRSDLKGQGLGRLLMERLIDYARASGLQVLTGMTLPDNERLLALARALGFKASPVQDGAVQLRLQLQAR
ncbi:bifunctional acetate--CoA ligase family protein/GNAT family N-acetyltransferase [Pseudoduganella ginsengisoli]|uniref:GNAT family N-acetyltransferase n=1 Tax=Pseudoduganella ginsengisoli TaxID=1462440 RepID=A0A6L6Q3Z6_9BURK|nr:bifunctional acetate--CoA ligase family protein/GNAT family N-acetyltransferase [Pseudoduganella ginsengisoli]MTW04557.1 GNAT family N-acetyltransferase [Pseudoduganella ginsengisoli]